jgi:transposase-like protein
MKYSPERREAILRKLLPPNNRPVTEVAQEEGISDSTLYNWRNEARKAGQLFPDHGSDPEGWNSRDKFNGVLETAALNESELGEYCRKRGIYPEQVRRRRQSCETANERDKRLVHRLGILLLPRSDRAQ